MKNASNEFKQIVYDEGNKQYFGKAEIELMNGTLLPIANSDIWEGGIQITEQTSNSDNFDIGFCACNQLVFKLDNSKGKFSTYDFNNTVIRPYIGLKLSESIEYLKFGVYTVDLPEQIGNYINLTCMDNMHKLDKKITSLNGNTAGTLVNNICLLCGVSLKVTNFDGYNRELTMPENVTDYTFRQTLSFICQSIGTFARFDGDGLLEIKWYDTGAFETSDNLNGGTFDNTTETSYKSGDTADGGDFTFSETSNYDGGTFIDMSRYHHIYSLQNINVATDDVVITGIKIINDEESFLVGTEDYALAISDNPFTIGREKDIANYLGSRIIGMRFRPVSVTCRSNPLIEAGDPAYISDRKGNSYQTYITNFNFVIRQAIQVSCDAATPQQNSAEGLSAKTETIMMARRAAKQAINSYDLTVQQLNNLVMHSFGVYHTNEKLEDGSTIEYSHDKPTLSESENIWKQTANTFTVSNDGGKTWRGMDADGNMVVTVLNAIGINAEWINVGTLRGIRIEVQSGKIANMEIVENGLSMAGDETYDYFLIRVGNSDLVFYGGQINISTMYEKNADPNQRQVTTLNLGNGGINLTTNNYENTKGAGINVFDDSNGNPVLNLYSRNENGLNNNNINVNGVAILNSINIINTRIEKIASFLNSNFGYNIYEGE